MIRKDHMVLGRKRDTYADGDAYSSKLIRSDNMSGSFPGPSPYSPFGLTL